MELQLKAVHNLTAYLVKDPKNPKYDQMVERLASSQYLVALTTNPPIHVETLRRFWANAEVQTHEGKPMALVSKINDRTVTILPATLSRSLQLNDSTAPTSFTKGEMHATFVQHDYTGNLATSTLFKKNFEPPCKYVFHTILQSLGPKSTGWDQMPSSLQYIFYSVLANTPFKASNYFFQELLKNHSATKDKYLLYPRFIMKCLIDAIGDDALIGEASIINGLTRQIFARMDTPALLAAEATEEEPPPVVTQSAKPKRTKHKSKAIPRKPKRTHQEAEMPDEDPALQMPIAQVETSSQPDAQTSPAQLAPPTSSQQEGVVSIRAPTQRADVSVETLTQTLQPEGDSFSQPAIEPSFNVLLDAILHDTRELSPTHGSPIPTHIQENAPTYAMDLNIPVSTPGDEDVDVGGTADTTTPVVLEATTTLSSAKEAEDSRLISKTSITSTADASKAHDAGSPQGAHEQDPLDTTHDETDNVRDAGDSINLDDASTTLLKELTAKVESLESEVLQLKELITKMAQDQVHQTQSNPMVASPSALGDHSNTPPTTQQPPIIPSVGQPGQGDPFGPQQVHDMLHSLLTSHLSNFRISMEHQHNKAHQLMQIHLDTQYKELTRMIQDNRAQIAHLTGITPPAPWFPQAEDEAKKGEKESLLEQARKAKQARDETQRLRMKELHKKNLEAKMKKALEERVQHHAAEERRLRNLPNPPPSTQGKTSTPVPPPTTLQSQQVPSSKPQTQTAQTIPEPVQSSPIKTFSRRKRKFIVQEEEEDQPTEQPLLIKSSEDFEREKKEQALLASIFDRADLTDDQKVALYAKELEKADQDEHEEERRELTKFILSNSKRQRKTLAKWSTKALQAEAEALKTKLQDKEPTTKQLSTSSSSQPSRPKKAKAVPLTFQDTARGKLAIFKGQPDVHRLTSASSILEYKKRIEEQDMVVYEDIMRDEKPYLISGLKPDQYAYKMEGTIVDDQGRKAKATELHLPFVGTAIKKTNIGSAPRSLEVPPKAITEDDRRRRILNTILPFKTSNPGIPRVVDWSYSKAENKISIVKEDNSVTEYNSWKKMQDMKDEELYSILDLDLEDGEGGKNEKIQGFAKRFKEKIIIKLLAKIRSQKK